MLYGALQCLRHDSVTLISTYLLTYWLFGCLYLCKCGLCLHIICAAFRALLDNYEADTRRPETVTPNEERENCYFLDVVMETSVMQTAHQFLVSQGKASSDLTAFKQLLYRIWFKLYKRRRGDRLVHGLFTDFLNCV